MGTSWHARAGVVVEDAFGESRLGLDGGDDPVSLPVREGACDRTEVAAGADDGERAVGRPGRLDLDARRPHGDALDGRPLDHLGSGRARVEQDPVVELRSQDAVARRAAEVRRERAAAVPDDERPEGLDRPVVVLGAPPEHREHLGGDPSGARLRAREHGAVDRRFRRARAPARRWRRPWGRPRPRSPWRVRRLRTLSWPAREMARSGPRSLRAQRFTPEGSR